MPRRTAKQPVVDLPSHLVRTTTWSGLHEGDAVDVLDDREPGATWRFLALVNNEASGAAWVEVVGGRRGDERRRSFRPDQVYPQGSVRRGVATSASLDEAPRLPL